MDLSSGMGFAAIVFGILSILVAYFMMDRRDKTLMEKHGKLVMGWGSGWILFGIVVIFRYLVMQ